MSETHRNLVSNLAPGKLLSLLLVSTLILHSSCSFWPVKPADTVETGFQELYAEAEAAITDSDRREAYLASAQLLEAELQSWSQQAEQSLLQFRAAFVDQDVGEDQLAAMASEFRSGQYRARERFIELHLNMARSVNSNEWKTLAPREAAIVQAMAAVVEGRAK